MTFQKSKRNFKSRFEIMIREIFQFVRIFNNVIIYFITFQIIFSTTLIILFENLYIIFIKTLFSFFKKKKVKMKLIVII